MDELFRAVDTDKSRSIDYAEFRRALRTPCAVEKWANTIPWPKLFTHFIHPSKSERHKHNPLGGLLDLVSQAEPNARAAVDHVIDSMTPYLKQCVYQHLKKLQQTVDAVPKDRMEWGEGEEGKFKSVDFKRHGSVGTLKEFTDGLSARVGHPEIGNIFNGMEKEHTCATNCHKVFVSSNYSLKTSANIEWWIVKTGEDPAGNASEQLEKAFANAFGTREPASRLMKQYSKQSAAHGRKYCSVDERLKKGLCQGGDERDRLTKAEVFAIALYTGPQSLLCTHRQTDRQTERERERERGTHTQARTYAQTQGQTTCSTTRHYAREPDTRNCWRDPLDQIAP